MTFDEELMARSGCDEAEEESELCHHRCPACNLSFECSKECDRPCSTLCNKCARREDGKKLVKALRAAGSALQAIGAVQS